MSSVTVTMRHLPFAATLPRTLPDAFSALLASTVNCLSFQLPR